LEVLSNDSELNFSPKTVTNFRQGNLDIPSLVEFTELTIPSPKASYSIPFS
jgi:hypothetical protein